MNSNESPRILLPSIDTKENYLMGFWQWVHCMARFDYKTAIESLYWPSGNVWEPAALEKKITTFFGGTKPWRVIVPNDRLIAEINALAEFAPAGSAANGWFLAHIPVTNSELDSKDDSIPLEGLATSFFVRNYGTQYAMSIEIFHA